MSWNFENFGNDSLTVPLLSDPVIDALRNAQAAVDRRGNLDRSKKIDIYRRIFTALPLDELAGRSRRFDCTRLVACSPDVPSETMLLVSRGADLIGEVDVPFYLHSDELELDDIALKVRMPQIIDVTRWSGLEFDVPDSDTYIIDEAFVPVMHILSSKSFGPLRTEHMARTAEAVIDETYS